MGLHQCIWLADSPFNYNTLYHCLSSRQDVQMHGMTSHRLYRPVLAVRWWALLSLCHGVFISFHTHYSTICSTAPAVPPFSAGSWCQSKLPPSTNFNVFETSANVYIGWLFSTQTHGECFPNLCKKLPRNRYSHPAHTPAEGKHLAVLGWACHRHEHHQLYRHLVSVIVIVMIG